jgi:hypothetical protein
MYYCPRLSRARYERICEGLMQQLGAVTGDVLRSSTAFLLLVAEVRAHQRCIAFAELRSRNNAADAARVSTEVMSRCA